MKSKAPLLLIELCVMLLVLALAAALCLQAFVWADSRSDRYARRDQADIRLQSAAEILKECGGEFEEAAALYGGSAGEDGWTVLYDENWQQTSEKSCYVLTAVPVSTGTAGLGAATVKIEYDGEILTEVKVCWQEVGNGA